MFTSSRFRKSANPEKYYLVSIRSLALLLLLFILFEPILSLAKKVTLTPHNLIFVDNSRSMQIKDGSERIKNTDDFLEGFGNNNLVKNSTFYTFGNKVMQLNYDSIKALKFNEGSTNFSKIFENLENKDENISSITIVSDGVITDGDDPTYKVEKLGIPVNTIGVGDTASRNDVEIKNVLYNQYIYAQTPTTIVSTILNKGFSGKNISVSLLENGVVQDKQNVTLSSDGVQNINLSYTPKSGGEKKLEVVASSLDGEFTKSNNKKIFYVNVLSNKVKVLVIAGAPSSDLAFIKNTLNADDNLQVNSITQINQGQFLEKNNRQQLIDSADIFILVGFPSKETDNTFLSLVKNAIVKNNKPFLITLSNGIDFNKLRNLNDELGFSFGSFGNDYNEIQPNISAEQNDNPLLQNNADNPIEAWNNLPPVLQPDIKLSSKPEAEVISKVKINNVPINIPLIVTRRVGSQKSISVLAKNIWRWKLQTATKNLDLFDRFILSSIKWLNAKDNLKQVTIRTSKKVYSLGEQVEFSAQVYDATFNPVSDASVQIKVKNEENENIVNLNSVGNGIYEGTFQSNQQGDYSFTGVANQNGKKLGEDKGKFNIGEADVEMMNPKMNYDFLKLLANQSGGKFYVAPNYSDLYPILKKLTTENSKQKINVSEINLWSDKWLMFIIIILFAIEWFLRKRAGML